MPLNRLEVDAQVRHGRALAHAENSERSCRCETLAALSEQRDAIEEVIEPYLIQQGLLQRSPRGRLLTANGFRYLGLAISKRAAEQLDLLGDEAEGAADA
jgi:Holliday junction DNA helicase RuvB